VLEIFVFLRMPSWRDILPTGKWETQQLGAQLRGLRKMMVPLLHIAFGTACGEKKLDAPAPMHRLYCKSPRIKAIYSRKRDFPLYILSAEYGLVEADETRAPYDRRMDLERARELAPAVADVLKDFDWFIFFNPQTPMEYTQCVKWAADLCNVRVAFIGWWPLGGLDDCLLIADALKETGRLPENQIRSLEVYPQRT